MKNDIALIGLAVMGENLALNLESKGFRVGVYNRTYEKTRLFTDGKAKRKNITGYETVEELVASLSVPRIIFLMVKAGKPVDDMMENLIPFLSTGDVIIDGGNSSFKDTERRVRTAESEGILFVGTGVSGGEEGALKGPSLMPGGNERAWPLVKDILVSVSAKYGDDPCCRWIGEGGSGHFVKMVHNGIEYGDMQLICETYHIMRDLMRMTADEISLVFSEWGDGPLDSYLIDITSDILAFKDRDGSPLVEKILDTAGQKGTGALSTAAALEEGVPLTLIGEAVFSRFLSSLKEIRQCAAEKIPKSIPPFEGDRESFIRDLENALYASKIISYAQGFELLSDAGKKYGWDLDLAGIALIWRGGCIIRSAFLNRIGEAFQNHPALSSLILDPFFSSELKRLTPSWRRVVSKAVESGIPVPGMASALEYFDGLTCENLPANLLQAQRDYFGAHTYERTDRERGEFFHTEWLSPDKSR